MVGSPSDESGVSELSNGTASGDQSGESLEEWRSGEQVENGTPSTSPPYCDTDNDDDDDDCEPKPSSLYGKYTWKIENFKKVNKRELRSNSFEVGGYDWYILIYPQGCDVQHHLSLFLCVANHDKLLPGWSHFAQFTIAVVNKDQRKSKYSDTLHRFWKKEHDWGWKKFMELSKVDEGFIVADALVIKAQVQVIRENTQRPFRCLDSQYRNELVRVYLTNVEQICRRFVEEKRSKIGKLIEDESRWSSFHDYWYKVDENVRHHMSREKTEVILKVAVKHFFIEKEMTSTLVMDSLYSGLKALTRETPDPIVCVENDMFVLAGDVIPLLVRASAEPLPPKDEKGPQNRTKDGSSGEELNKDSSESDERRDQRRLKELGRRTVEIFVLSHIFSNKIEIAYQNAIALEKQEELIREEAQSKIEQKARRGVSEKEKRSKKKQSKQKRGGRKMKDKGKDEKFDVVLEDNKQNAGSVDIDERNGFSVNEVQVIREMPDGLDDVSDVSFNGDDTSERFQPCTEDRDASPLNSDTDTSDVHQIDGADPQSVTEASSIRIYSSLVQNGRSGNKTNSVRDDSSSTCSTDSVPSVQMSGSNRISCTDSVPSAPFNGSIRGNSLPSHKIQILPNRGKKHHGKDRHARTSCAPDLDNRNSEPVTDVGCLRDASGTCGATDLELEVNDISVNNQIQHHETQMDQKEEIVAQQKKLIASDQELISKQMAKTSPSSSNHSRNHPSIVPPKTMPQSTAAASGESSLKCRQVSEKKVPVISKLDARRSATLPEPVLPNGKQATHAVPETLMGSSAPLNLAPKSSIPAVSLVQTTPLLSRSVSATGRLEIGSSAAPHSYAPSYKNAIMGRTLGGNPNVLIPSSSNSSLGQSRTYTQPQSTPLPSPISLSQRSEGNEQNVVSGFTFGSVNPKILQNCPQWLEYSQRDDATMFSHPSASNGIQKRDTCSSSSVSREYSADGIQKHDTCSPSGVSRAYFADGIQKHETCSPSSVSRAYFTDDLTSSVSSYAPKHQAKGATPEEFPHLDMINDLFDEEHNNGQVSKPSSTWSSYGGHAYPRPHSLNRQFTFPGEVAMPSDPGSFNYHQYQLDSSQSNGLHLPYGSSSSGNYSGLRDAIPGLDQSAYGNGHVNGVTPSQWLYGSAPDLSLLNMRNNEGDDYSYQMPLQDYSNLLSGVNRYTSFHPSNRH